MKRPLVPSARRLSTHGAACLAFAFVVANASGQVIQGRISDAGSEQGIAGAMVTVVDRGGDELGRVLSWTNGQFVVRADRPGELRVRVDRIGYATTFSDFVHVASGDTVMLSLASTAEAISLEGVEASADRRCELRPAEGLAVAKVWEEARKALAATAWTEERGMYRYETLRVRRQMDEAGWDVESEDRIYGEGYSSAPYVARSADSLVTHGFAEITAAEARFWGPDAEVLLSESFLSSYCFRLVPGEGLADEGATGIAFEPAEGRDIPGISGTMWVNRRTAQLQRVDFRFINLNVPPWLLAVEPGGSVEFLELANGSWIIPSWHLRTFRAGDGGTHPLTGRPYPTLEGVTVHAGQVLRAHGDDGVVFEGAPGHRIAGVIRDSLGAALPEARVFVAGSGLETTTDSDGRFELTHLAPGQYTLYFSHRYLDAVWYPPEPFSVTMAAATESVAVTLDAPPLKDILGRICDNAEPPSPMFSSEWPPRMISRDGILSGHVRDRNGVAVGDARVIVIPDAFEVGELMDPEKGRAMENQGLRSWVVARTSSEGFYRACWVPLGVPLEVMVLSEDEFDQRWLEEHPGLRDIFPDREVRSLALDDQAPHRTLNIEATARAPTPPVTPAR